MRALEGRVAVITGAARGIGRAAVEVFVRHGATVVACDIDEEHGSATVEAVRRQGGSASFVAADVSVRRDVAALVSGILSEHGGLHCAFNNAGITGPLHPLVGYPEEDYQRVLAINVGGVWNCLQEEIPAMLASGGGAIVNASSGLGVVASPGMAAYVAAKHAVLGLTQTAALEYSAAGVRVNAVLPGVIDTDMPARLTVGSPQTMAAMRAAHPIGRLGRAEEVAETAAWLCSPAASFVTGHGMAVDGGHLVQ